MLEQDAQMFGLRDSTFPVAAIGSPQHLQIRVFMRLVEDNRLGMDWGAMNRLHGPESIQERLHPYDTATLNL